MEGYVDYISIRVHVKSDGRHHFSKTKSQSDKNGTMRRQEHCRGCSAVRTHNATRYIIQPKISNYSSICSPAEAFLSGLQAEDVLPGAAAKVVRWATGLEKRLDAELQLWDKFLSETIAEHLEKKKCDGRAGEDDFLDVLLRLREEGTAGLELTDDRIKSIIKDIIAAGTDTSSVTLEWAMAELVGNPPAMAKLQDEISRATEGKPSIEEDDLRRMEYLRAVLKEVLRLHPVAPLLVPHQSTTMAVVQGYEIPAETALFVNAWAIGRDPAAWGPTAEEFQPERFLGGGGAEGVDLRGNDYQLLPFGAGRRLCPGIGFAMPVLEMALSSLVRHFDWELPAGARLDMSEAPGLTTPPLAPLRLAPKCRGQQ
ncbi:unnamed protein product [Triticum turgidum subsp. durum]|uniref:Cytochrome P450 n=1 Tax=Triticum turgidum subsp. durum TaxID=4567 RepID=A0A9R0TX76_TRITD|nr:unnamed protein product [Triticum turgidum subsp. durum]